MKVDWIKRLEKAKQELDSLPKPHIPTGPLSKIETGLRSLTPVEEKIVELRYGLRENHGMPMTFKMIGKCFDRTGERIRQRFEIAMKKLSHPSRSVSRKELLEESDRLWKNNVPSTTA